MASELFRLHQDVAHVGEEEDGDDKQGDHGWSDLFKPVYGTEAEREERQSADQQEQGQVHGA
jgi:hypothetical protein